MTDIFSGSPIHTRRMARGGMRPIIEKIQHRDETASGGENGEQTGDDGPS